MMNTKAYLESTDVIDWKTQAVHDLARHLAMLCDNPDEVIRSCFEWVRDEIGHSGDIHADVVTCSASEVLEEKTGWCFAKSHLLAALLRANDIPAGLCYQRLRRDDETGYTLHGLNGVLLPNIGWFRLDARGNKPGVNTQFTPPAEQLAWPAVLEGERNLPDIYPQPLPTVVACLKQSDGWKGVQANLPDMELIKEGQNK
jgi:transglutaminase-like putative cysteine protease